MKNYIVKVLIYLVTIFGPTCAGKTIFMSWIQGKPRLSNGSTVGSYIY